MNDNIINSFAILAGALSFFNILFLIVYLSDLDFSKNVQKFRLRIAKTIFLIFGILVLGSIIIQFY